MVSHAFTAVLFSEGGLMGQRGWACAGAWLSCEVDAGVVRHLQEARGDAPALQTAKHVLTPARLDARRRQLQTVRATVLPELVRIAHDVRASRTSLPGLA
jgi:hypothetical protein